MKTYMTFMLLIASLSGIAQTTAIPDPNFEQELINQGIDSDGVINGQILTADISNIINLDIANKGIQNLTGLEDFTALISLDVSGNYLSQLDLTSNTNLKILHSNQVGGLTTLNLSGNLLLEELYCSNWALDAPVIFIQELDLSNNTNLHAIYLENVPTLKVNLKTGANSTMTGLYMDISTDGGPRPAPKQNNCNGICIQVDDKNAAEQNLYPYSTWTIIDTNSSYCFSEDCTLSIESPQYENIQIYPNPVNGFLSIKNPNGQLEKIEVYDVRGKRLKSYSKGLLKIDMQSFAPGIYFLKIYSDKVASVEKILKK